MASHTSHVKTYITVYLALMVLVLVTIAAAHVHMGPLAFPVAMAIAGLKTFLIVAVFMHVKDELPLVRIFSVLGLFWLPIMFVFMLADYMTRPNTYAGVRNTTTLAEVESGDSAPSHGGSASEAAH